MKRGIPRHQTFVRKVIFGLAVGGLLLSAALQNPANAQQPSAPQPQSQLGVFNTAVEYVSTFW